MKNILEGIKNFFAVATAILLVPIIIVVLALIGILFWFLGHIILWGLLGFVLIAFVVFAVIETMKGK